MNKSFASFDNEYFLSGHHHFMIISPDIAVTIPTTKLHETNVF